MSTNYGPNPEQAGTPSSLGSPVTPQQMIGNDHSFTLQAIMELTKGTGELKSSIESLKSCVEKQELKIDKLETTVSTVTHKIYAATVVLAILVAVGAFIVNKSWDMMASQISSAQSHTVSISNQAKKPNKKN
ncbi:MAG: hypothetical protein HFP81_00145 [Methylococcales symbiont of Hymedesmia sp. n. MRB-2018]|nr:MAG: hypothetical protein HFP78_00120 [Methylococcales symbiont of Hymedesmia sp. n. MRB-2018]KAF3984832.1 MAG: hypothetical protein HFP81_00145 [Methylococcales symbiont of Hymedesmia sp. n. MRB-2018]